MVEEIERRPGGKRRADERRLDDKASAREDLTLFPAGGGGSAGEIRPRKNAEARNETASAAMANGADNICTKRPPRPGPPTSESARLRFRITLPST